MALFCLRLIHLSATPRLLQQLPFSVDGTIQVSSEKVKPEQVECSPSSRCAGLEFAGSYRG